MRWFWKEWNTEHRFHFYLIWVISIVLVGLAAYYFFAGPEAQIQWQHYQEQKEIEVIVHEFSIGNFSVSIPASVFVVYEFFQGGELTPQLATAYLFVAILFFAFIYFQTIFSALERFSFFGGLTLLILFIVSLRLEVLRVFGLQGQWFTVAVIAVFTLCSFYLNKFRPETTFGQRFLIFSLLAVLVTACIGFGAEVPLPFLYLSVTGYVPGLVIALLFVMVVAQEIPASFLYLTGSSQSLAGMRHFLVVMIVYLLNLVLLYIQQRNIVDWDVFAFNIHFLILISTLLGIWGWKHREARYGSLMPFAPFGAYVYALLASVAFSFFVFMAGTSQDATLTVLADISVFLFIGYALAFLLYVLSNFLGVADKNLSVWKVLYKP
nr:hypothetical protein [Cyclobacteriaceae bacterium]